MIKMGTLQDYNKDGPVLAEPEYDVRYIEPYHRCVEYFIENIDEIDRFSDMRRLREVIKELFDPIQTSDLQPIISRKITHAKKHPRLVK